MTTHGLLRVLGYVWASFGAFWIVLAPWVRQPRFYTRVPPLVLTLTFLLLLLLRSALPPLAIILAAVAWTVLGLSWARPRETVVKDEASVYRWLRLAILAITFALLFWDRAAMGFLGESFLPPAAAMGMTGFLLALLGLAIAIWARLHLGSYWSDKVMLQADHRLIESGPYAYVRHPIYAGVLLAVLGTALVEGEWRGALAFLLLLTNYAIKAKREEQVLSQQFRPVFEQYAAHAGFFLPRFRSRAGRG
jgi:protein-S-isoprenylcysteine O-methyltransferase Ste14